MATIATLVYLGPVSQVIVMQISVWLAMGMIIILAVECARVGTYSRATPVGSVLHSACFAIIIPANHVSRGTILQRLTLV